MITKLNTTDLAAEIVRRSHVLANRTGGDVRVIAVSYCDGLGLILEQVLSDEDLLVFADRLTTAVAVAIEKSGNN